MRTRASTWAGGWRIALRIAWREALRAKGRSILVLVMVALPVLGVTAADILIRTSQVSAVESVDRTIGDTAAVRVGVVGAHAEQMSLDPFGDPEYDSSGSAGRTRLDDVLGVLGGGRPATTLDDGQLLVDTNDGRGYAQGYELDPTSPLTSGLMRLTSGRWPREPGEVVVNGYLAGRGPGLGDRLVMHGAHRRKATATVVGIGESAIYRDEAVVAGLPGSLTWEYPARRGWLVGGGDVTWQQVVALNRIGAVALSRYAVHHPPDLSQYGTSDGVAAAVIAIALLIVVMALIEVVLLAGPAFAVGAKRQARALALMAASGGTPQQARRVVLASGVVLGLLGAVLGVVLGIPVARLIEPLVQRTSQDWLGPFEIRWHEVLGVAAFGLISALLAAVVPAWIASRQDVVAVLSGRRGDRRPGVKSPILGLVLLGVGIVVAVLGTRGASATGAVFIAASAVICVLGMILLVPVLVAAVARLGARLPLPMRFAVRDASRHRTRTVPAVAAVAATVAAVVTLGIAISSNDAQNRAGYQPQLAMGNAEIRAGGRAPDWNTTIAVVHARLPGETVDAERGVFSGMRQTLAGEFRTPAGRQPRLFNYMGFDVNGGDSDVLVSDGRGLTFPTTVDDAAADSARSVLAAGGVVVFTTEPTDASTATVVIRIGHRRLAPVTVPAAYVATYGDTAPARGVLSPQVADRLGLQPTTIGLLLSGTTIDKDQEQGLSEALTALPGKPTVYVERGYQTDSSTRILELVLAGLGGLLMLGGTLTATYLSLADARPDLATLAAVGAEPRTRRLVAAAYALTVGVLGALLGAVVGLVPGIAITYPITGSTWSTSGASAVSHYLDVPWLLLIVVVVGLPVIVAILVGLTTRSRLPMVARLS